MAAFLGSHDPNIPGEPYPISGLHNHAAASLLSSSKGSSRMAHANVLPRRLPLYLLKKMTNNFSQERELGTGACGKVYKGVHKNGETIAVKLLHPTQLDDKQFTKEFLNLTCLQHQNIVRLVGFCNETRQECLPHNGKLVLADVTHRALCFEYMHNGSLNNYIFDESSGHDWSTRYAIINGICKGLKYLHEELEQPIYHLDLKPANILLDDNMVPKIADFGLSRLFGQERTRITESCIGTRGYLPPEYIERNEVSNKLDIFSLGVIIIKIIAGPTGYSQCAEMPPKKFIDLVHDRWRHTLQARSLHALETYCEQVMRCIEMALRCVEKDRHKRPSIGDIVDMLNKIKTKDQTSPMDQVLSMDICSTPAQASLPASYTIQETTNTTGGRLREHIQYVMGGLAIGLARSAVEGTVIKATSAIEEAKLQMSVQRDLIFIINEFHMMQSFLNVAHEERLKNFVVRTWVRQIRSLAYDVDDLIELIGHLDNKWWHALPSCMTPPSPLEEAVEKMRMVKARVEDVSRRNVRYNLISDSGSKPVLEQQQLALGYDTRRQQVLGDLTHLITKKDDADLQVISLWGSKGSIGTTSIIRKSYIDPEISDNFTCRAWVNLTHPFNSLEFVRSLMVHFYANSSQERQGAIIGVDVLTSMDASPTQGDLLSEFVQLVDTNRYLVVLEDLSTMAEWDAIRTFLPDRKNGSWIIVSSQQREIASLCVGDPYQVLQLKHSSAEVAVFAFMRECFQGVGDKSEGNNGSGSSSTSDDEISAEYELSHSRGHSSYHKISPSKRKAARDWMHNSHLVGCRLVMNQLRQYTAEAQTDHSQVMSVWGIAGVGKSALVRNLYYDRIIDNQQFEEYGWVGLSHSHPFNLRDFSRSLLLDFQSESAHSRGKIKDAVQKCRELLSTRRCLVIIDDLQSTQDWDLIQSYLVSRHSKSRSVIIVITNEASVAAYCADKEGLVFKVKPLEPDTAFDLLKNEVSRRTPLPTSFFDGEDAVPRELISKCGGLPLIIIAIAGSLATKATKATPWVDTASCMSLGFMHELEISPEFDGLWDLYSWMHSSFRTCPDSLKSCILYLPFFPRDHNIRRRRIVRRWIAEGYTRDNVDKSCEENGEDLFSKLLNLGIIQQPPQSTTTMCNDLRMVFCRANGFLRECIISQAMEENLVLELAARSCLTTLGSRCQQHLVILESWDRDRIVFESIDFSQLRSLTVFGQWRSFFTSHYMKLLRVLDLEDASGVTDHDLEGMVELLRHLKFLSLRGCCEIFHLPSSIGNLRKLQTLDMRNTSIITLPENITRLQKLQYIRAGSTTVSAEEPSISHNVVSWSRRVGVHVPRGIGKLTALHTFGVVNIGVSRGKAILKEIKNLIQLRKLGVFGVNRKNSEAFASAISNHYHLESLSVRLDKDSQGCLDVIYLPMKNLQSLKLYGLADRLPVIQANHLSKLIKLDLEMASLMEEDIQFLGELPKLCLLRLCVTEPKDGKIHFCGNGLQSPSYIKVKILEIACISSLHVTFGSETMKKLELLKIDCYSGSSYQFCGLEHLSELKEVLLKGSFDDTLKQHLQSQLADNPQEPVLKMEGELPGSS